MNELSPITELKGIGEKTKKLFERVGIATVSELLYYFPRDYEKYGELQSADTVKDHEMAVLYGYFPVMLAVKRIKNRQITSGIFESGSLK